jgi:hypothetical protein
MKAREIGNNVSRLLNSIDSWVNLETLHGVIREGRLSGWSCHTFQLDGNDVQIPVSIELNGDPTDTVNLRDVRKIDLVERKDTA